MPRPVLLLLGAGGAVLLVAGLNSMANLVARSSWRWSSPSQPTARFYHLLERGLPGWVAGLAMMLVIY